MSQEGSRFWKHVSCDDKSKVKLGPTGYSVALATRNMKVLAHNDLKFEASDHDMGIKDTLCPSVTFDVEVLDEPNLRNFLKGENFYFHKNRLRSDEMFRFSNL